MKKSLDDAEAEATIPLLLTGLTPIDSGLPSGHPLSVSWYLLD